MRALGLEGGALDLVLDVYNPNEYRMDATRLTYTLESPLHAAEVREPRSERLDLGAIGVAKFRLARRAMPPTAGRTSILSAWSFSKC